MKKIQAPRNIRFIQLVSFSCVIHCIITPFIIILVPSFGSYLKHMAIEFGLLLFSILCGALITFKDFCHHKKTHSISLFLLASIFWAAHYWLEPIKESLALLSLIFGSLLALVSYFLKCCPSLNMENS